jgi:RNase P protein component
VKNNVERNFFRRDFYDIAQEYLSKDIEGKMGFDLVFVVKKKTKLDKKNESLINDFRKDINFLFNKVVNT